MAVPAALSTIHNPATGTIPPATWGDHIETLTEFLKAPPSAKVKKSAAQAINNGASTTVSWNQEDWDTDAIHDNATNNTRLTCKTAGKYGVWANIHWATSASGSRGLGVLINGITVHSFNYPAASTLDPEVGAYCEVQLAVNDYVEIQVYQNSGGALNLSNVDSAFGMRWFST